MYTYIHSAHFHLARHLAVSASFLFALYSQLDSRARKMLYLVHRTYTHFLSFFLRFHPSRSCGCCCCCCFVFLLLSWFAFFMRETVPPLPLHPTNSRYYTHTHNDKLKVREKERDRATERVQVRVCAKKERKQLTSATRENSKANRKKEKCKTNAYILWMLRRRFLPFRSRRRHRHHHHYNIIAIVENASNNILGDRIKAYATIMCIRMDGGRESDFEVLCIIHTE